MKNMNRPFLVAGTLLIIAIAAFIYNYFQASGTISKNVTKISSLGNQVASANAQISTLQSQVASDNAQISTLQSQVASDNAQISTLQSQVASANSQISTLQSQVASDNAQISSLQSQLSAGGSQISTLQSQISSLKSQNSDLQSITALGKSSTKADSRTINQAAGQSSSVVTFVADYAGYIIVSGTSTTTNGYVVVTDSYRGYPYNNYKYSFGTGATLTIPVLPGNVSVSFGNSNFSGGATATLTVGYYY